MAEPMTTAAVITQDRETRGLFWPWLIHFLSDVAIFSFVALAPISPP